jgi:3-oxosteroid 1-dehydrogenase
MNPAAALGLDTAVREEVFDFIIVGSGGGSVPAALVMKEHGRSVLIIEKQAVIGGSSAFSGGVIWIPNNDHLNAAGGGDSHERARAYLDGLIGEVGPASSVQRRDAFIRRGAEMVRYLEGHGMKFLHAHWPDYYDNRPGGLPQGRSLCAPLFDVKALGEWAPKLAHFPMTSGLPVTSRDAVAIFVAKQTWRGKWVVAKLALRMLQKKLLGTELRGAGNALQGRLFQIALRAGTPIWTDTAAKDFLVDGGRVTGVIVERSGRTVRLGARLGVLINAGGFSRNLGMREQYQPKPTSVKWTQANPGDTGEMIQAAMGLGAAVDLMDEAWWLACSFMPDGTFMGMHSPNDIGKPHCIAVDARGRRFANESNSYMEFGQRMYAAGAVPAWAVFDSRHRRSYPWGMTLPGAPPAALIDSGYMRRFASLDELARGCGIDPAGLAHTVVRFNGFARTGVDEDFSRGTSAYNHYYGDPTVKPNPNLGSIEQPPFYAVALYPSDVGTSGGVLTDEFARVLRPDGSVVPGLYATGNSAASMMGRCYPGAGVSIGPSMTFGYIAARHAAGDALSHAATDG